MFYAYVTLLLHGEGVALSVNTWQVRENFMTDIHPGMFIVDLSISKILNVTLVTLYT